MNFLFCTEMLPGYLLMLSSACIAAAGILKTYRGAREEESQVQSINRWFEQRSKRKYQFRG